MRRKGDRLIRLATESRVALLKGFGRCIGSSFYPPGPLLALELQNWNRRGTTGRKQALTDPDLFDGRMRANVTDCPAYSLNAGLSLSY